MDPKLLADAVAFAQSHESEREMDFSDQEHIFGSLLGPVPTSRAKTNGLVIHNGYIVAEFGDTTAVDPTYSVAKSMLSTVAGIAVREGHIKNVDAPVGTTIKDGGYDSPHNAQSPGRCTCSRRASGKARCGARTTTSSARTRSATASGSRASGRRPGTFYEYNDVRINRFALSLLRSFKKPVPDVFRDEIMDPIGASDTWKWVPYHNSYVEIDGKKMASVSGGTRWGGGVWINSWDMARFGYLWLRGGSWGDRQIAAAGARQGGADAERSQRPRLRLPVVAQHAGQELSGPAATAFGAQGPAATPSPSRPTTTWWWSGGGIAEMKPSLPSAWWPPSPRSRLPACANRVSASH